MSLLLRGVFALVLAALSLAAHAQLGLSPNHFDLSEAEATRTQSFRLTNFGTEAVQIRTELSPFDIDANGQVVETAPNERSLERHLAISPIEFEIPPGQSQVVRFAMRPVHTLDAGEYRGMVYFRLGGLASVGGKLTFPVSYRLGGAVYVQVGEPNRSAVIENVAVLDGTAVRFDLRSTGSANARMQGRYAVWSKAAWATGRELPPLPQSSEPQPEGLQMNAALPGRPALPGKSVSYAAALAEDGKRLPAGDYVLHVSGTLEGQAIERVIPFRVIAVAVKPAGQ